MRQAGDTARRPFFSCPLPIAAYLQDCADDADRPHRGAAFTLDGTRGGGWGSSLDIPSTKPDSAKSQPNAAFQLAPVKTRCFRLPVLLVRNSSVFDHAGPETRSRSRAPPFRLPLMTTASASRLILSRLNGWPICAPPDASPPASRPTTHGSAPMRFAISSSQWTCTTYPSPASRRTVP